VKRNLLVTLALAAAISPSALAQVTVRVTAPTAPSLTVTTTPAPVGTQVVLSASITFWVPAGITIVSDTRTTSSAVIVVQPTATYKLARPLYITTFERYSHDLRARGYSMTKSVINNGLARGEFRKGAERVTVISRANAKGAEVRVQTIGGPKFHPASNGKAHGNNGKG
jgi:hypothetical protein